MDLATFVIRMGLALLFGALMGLERQWHQRMAGTRTNALVSTAAASFTMIGLVVADPAGPSRIVGQIVTGIGFLGAGVIFKEGGTIHGLNTAATVWCSAAVGSLCGIGQIQYAVVLSLAVLLTNVALRPLAYKLRPEIKEVETNYHLELVCAANDETQVRALLLNSVDRAHVVLTSLMSEVVETGNRVRVIAEIKSPTRNDDCLEQIVARVSLEQTVSSIRWRAEALGPALE
jgi:putative Mg2+ transporter-C (MgtC) family protein